MAAALIPLALPIASEIITLITGLVHSHAPAAEAQLAGGTGPVKFTQVFQAVMTQLQAAAAAGQIAGVLPSDEAVKVVIQAVVTSMKLQGQLDSSTPAPAPLASRTATGAITAPEANNVVRLSKGQTMLVQVV